MSRDELVADTAAAGLPAALDAFNAELMHGQYLTGVLTALGGDGADAAREIAAIARRGSELLGRLIGEGH